MDILRQTFSNPDTAQILIRDGILQYYKENYSDFFEKNSDIINSSIARIQKSFGENTFPIMKVAYDAYPDHIGHLESDGCFRCHNDAFISETGRTISKDCDLCHTIAGQGNPESIQLTNIRESLEFIHPIDIDTAWKEFNCSECHKYLY